MSEHTFYYLLIIIELSLSPLIAYILLYITAPYGRHFRDHWGPHVNFKTAWVVMEGIASLSFIIAFFGGDRATNFISLIFLVLWNLHYLDRAILYPLQLPDTNKQMPMIVLMFGVLFNISNGYLNGRFLSVFGPVYTLEWLTDIRFLLGIPLFIAGFVINRASDQLLLKLRKQGEKDYKIPKGGLFNLISCPNYFGEIIEWCGWALATWSLPGLAFAIFTVANLVPRAYAHHRWYREKFPNYPKSRKSIIPYIF